MGNAGDGRPPRKFRARCRDFMREEDWTLLAEIARGGKGDLRVALEHEQNNTDAGVGVQLPAREDAKPLKKHEVTSKSVALAQHVGHMVRVKGTLVGEGKGGKQAME